MKVLHMNTSCVSILFFVMFMIQSMFLKSIDRAFYIIFLFGCILVVLHFLLCLFKLTNKLLHNE